MMEQRRTSLGAACQSWRNGKPLDLVGECCNQIHRIGLLRLAPCWRALKWPKWDGPGHLGEF